MKTNKSYHILNGDALLERFPDSIKGTRIVMRECFLDGNVKGATLEELYKNRTQFLNKHYDGVSKAAYNSKTVSQFEMILNIPQKADIFLWFEEDVFCQVNLWFVASLLVNAQNPQQNIFLVRPQSHAPYSYGHHSNEQLLEMYSAAENISNNLTMIATLWEMYRNNNLSALNSNALHLKEDFPFIHKATSALIESLPSETSIGRPKETLLALKKKLNTDEFGIIFKAFSVQEAIYGFGDLQVLRLLKELENE